MLLQNNLFLPTPLRFRGVGMFIVFILLCISPAVARERQSLWPEGKMPDRQPHQIAAMHERTKDKSFNPDEHRDPYLEWFEKPASPNGSCMILVPGGAYQGTVDIKMVEGWYKGLTSQGTQCVSLVYRTPRPKGLPIYRTAWEDAQRAVRLVRSQARERGLDPDRIGALGMSAGAHLVLMLATNSQTPAYKRVDSIDDIPCNIDIAVAFSPAYLTSDGESGTAATRDGYGPDVYLSKVFNFDSSTCPVSLHHGGIDYISPNGSTMVYRKLQQAGIPSELHLYPGKGHVPCGFDKALEFLERQGFFCPERRAIDSLFIPEKNIVPGRVEAIQSVNEDANIEWHIPKELSTEAIQIICCEAADSTWSTAVRKYLNSIGLTVVTLNYHLPLTRTSAAWYIPALKEMQRAVRVVRRDAASYGLDSDRIGIMGAYEGAFLAMMGVSSSLHKAYYPADATDKLSCSVQWGICLFPSFGRSEELTPDFSFDLKTAPTLFFSSSDEVESSICTVAAWEKMRAIGIQSELHQISSPADVCSPVCLESIKEFLQTSMQIIE